MFDTGLTHCLKVVKNDDSDLNWFFNAGEGGFIFFLIKVLTPTSSDLGVISGVYGEIGVMHEHFMFEIGLLEVEHGEYIVFESGEVNRKEFVDIIWGESLYVREVGNVKESVFGDCTH